MRPRDCTTAAARLGGALVVAAGTIGASLSALPPLPPATSTRLSSRSAEREAKVRPGRPGAAERVGFPRPAIAERCIAPIMVEHAGHIIADTRSSIRTPETSHPPSYYIPPDAIAPGVLRGAGGAAFCEWKGAALYWDVVVGDLVLPRVGWSYPDPTPPFAMLRDHVAFYAASFDRCSIDGKTLVP